VSTEKLDLDWQKNKGYLISHRSKGSLSLQLQKLIVSAIVRYVSVRFFVCFGSIEVSKRSVSMMRYNRNKYVVSDSFETCSGCFESKTVL
jgi:hypothetical protein